MPAILKKFVSKEATLEAAILNVVHMFHHFERGPCLCDVIPSDLKLAGREKRATDFASYTSFRKMYFIQTIIDFTIFDAMISKFGACLAQNNKVRKQP